MIRKGNKYKIESNIFASGGFRGGFGLKGKTVEISECPSTLGSYYIVKTPSDKLGRLMDKKTFNKEVDSGNITRV